MTEQTEQIGFSLEVDDEGWPPIGWEWLHATKTDVGLKIESLPLFVKDISVFDVIRVELNDERIVTRWSHVGKSKRSVVWIMTYGNYDADFALQALRELGCNTESLKSFKYYAVDVPAEIHFDGVDHVLESLDKNMSAVAFPSFRHE